MAPKILLLVYIHGFQGSSDTFCRFPADLTALLSHRLPHLEIKHLIFPTFETRGDLVSAVQKFRSWLEEQVIDLEVGLGTSSPTVDPGVGVVICGHSMGGIVGVEACLGIAGERVLRRESDGDEETGEGDMAQGAKSATEGNVDADVDADGKLEGDLSSLLFPYIYGVLAFDTPYLGISPGVVAHGAEGHWKEGKAWYEGASAVLGAWGVGATGKEGNSSGANASKMATEKGLPASSSSTSSSPTATQDKTAQTWTSKWGRTALIASAGLAATATLGTTAYLKRDSLTSGFTWISSHLQFVGCLARGAELRERIEKMVSVSRERKIGFANLYTLLAQEKGGGKDGRTFCNLPKPGSKVREVFKSTRNEKIADEVNAHMYMFVPKENPGYYGMSEQTLELICEWVNRDASMEKGDLQTQTQTQT